MSKYGVRVRHTNLYVREFSHLRSRDPFSEYDITCQLTREVMDATMYNNIEYAFKLRNDLMPKKDGYIVEVNGVVAAIMPEPKPKRKVWYKSWPWARD